MSPLLESLLHEIGDPHRPDLLQICPSILERLRGLPRTEQLELRREVTKIRESLVRDTDAWISHQILFQYLWHLTGVKAPQTEEQRVHHEKMRQEYAARNGDWYAAGTWLTPEEVGERIERRAADVLRESRQDAS